MKSKTNIKYLLSAAAWHFCSPDTGNRRDLVLFTFDEPWTKSRARLRDPLSFPKENCTRVVFCGGIPGEEVVESSPAIVQDRRLIMTGVKPGRGNRLARIHHCSLPGLAWPARKA